jgi:putative FmdB family regulatory protein
MPIYEYQCEACGHHLEKLQKISDPLLTDCPKCGKSALTKLVSAAGFRLKGSGWYETDFKGKDRNKAAKSSDSTGQSGSKGEAGKGPAAGGKADKKAS